MLSPAPSIDPTCQAIVTEDPTLSSAHAATFLIVNAAYDWEADRLAAQSPLWIPTIRVDTASWRDALQDAALTGDVSATEAAMAQYKVRTLAAIALY